MELYLTKMVLNPHSRRVQFEIGNPQELHKTVCGAFPAIENQAHLPHHERETPRNKFDILHRLDVDYRNGRIALLVQSTVEPVWNHLRENFLTAAVAENPAVKSIGESYAQIAGGMNLRFRLRANPTKRIGKSDTEAKARFKESEKGNIRRRVELRTDEDRIAWLKRKGGDAGFRLANVQVKEIENAVAVGQGKINFSKSRDSPQLTFGAVIFDGVLEVTDADKFRESLIAGIGTGKAYGFGLLSVAPSTN